LRVIPEIRGMGKLFVLFNKIQFVVDVKDASSANSPALLILLAVPM
jgi:hypothetical protein